jgi:hypothetical protein
MAASAAANGFKLNVIGQAREKLVAPRPKLPKKKACGLN